MVLRSLREAIPTRWPSKVDELRSLRRERPDLDLAGFLIESGRELEDVYDGGKSWSDLCAEAGAPLLPAGPHEMPLRKAVGRLLHVDDKERITTYRRMLAHPNALVSSMSERERRLIHMLVASVTDRAVTRSTTLQDAVELLWAHPQVRADLAAVLSVLDGRIDHLHSSIAPASDSPLQVHARYTRIEILAGMGQGSAAKIASWQSGVYEAKSANAELFAFTLDKSSSGFSPNTRYRDYAISRTLIHWESQSITRADSDTGLRYRNHERDGRSVLLFTRLHASDRAFWFLGPATYRGHTGEKPMAITWELAHPLPGDLYAAFAAAVA